MKMKRSFFATVAAVTLAVSMTCRLSVSRTCFREIRMVGPEMLIAATA